MQTMTNHITIKGARLHNLKNITLSIPKNKLVVFTGLSGSGKSTLAFDTLHKEGQRQFMESLGLVTYALSKPQVDAIEGLSPSISVDQHLTNHSPRSTVGTATEVFTYLRVLFARIGHRPCPACGADIPPSYDVNGSEVWADESDDESAAHEPKKRSTANTYPCPNCGAPAPEMGMAHFSFNKPAGACPTCTGLGTVHEANLDQLVDMERSILDGAILGWDTFYIKHNSETLQAAGQHYGFPFDPSLPLRELGPIQRDLLLYGVNSPQFRRHYPGIKPPETVSKGHFEGIITNLLRRYAEHIHDPNYREKMEKLLIQQTCPDCSGTRLRPGKPPGDGGRPEHRRCLAAASGRIGRLDRAAVETVSPDEWIIAEPIVDRPARARPATGGRGRGLSDAGTLLAHALGGRGAAPAPGCAARVRADRRAVRPRRADHRAAPARYRAARSRCCADCATWATRCWSSSTIWR